MLGFAPLLHTVFSASISPLFHVLLLYFNGECDVGKLNRSWNRDVALEGPQSWTYHASGYDSLGATGGERTKNTKIPVSDIIL